MDLGALGCCRHPPRLQIIALVSARLSDRRQTHPIPPYPPPIIARESGNRPTKWPFITLVHMKNWKMVNEITLFSSNVSSIYFPFLSN